MQPTGTARRSLSGRWQTRVDDSQPRAGTLTQRHGYLLETAAGRVEFSARLNQISRPGYCRTPGHCQSRSVPPGILINGLIDYNRTSNHNRHGYGRLKHYVHGPPNDAPQKWKPSPGRRDGIQPRGELDHLAGDREELPYPTSFRVHQSTRPVKPSFI
jgi:hypothetical protein